MQVAARVAVISLLLAALGACRGRPSETSALTGEPASPRANVIVLSFDALRADALGVYGRPRDVSPNLDRFARESWVFENAYSVSSQTPLSFAAAFTGRYPTRGDFRSPYEHWQLPAGPTLASTFAAAGYATAAFLANPWLRHPRFGAGFGVYRAYEDVADDVVLREAMGWLATQGLTVPIFLWIHLLDPHSPYRAYEGSKHLYAPGYSGAYVVEGLGTGTTSLAQNDPRELARLRDLYDGEVHQLDQRFGRWLEQLGALRRLDASILVVTSDHGEEFMEHGALQHSRLYEEHLRVPLIVRVPGDSGARRIGRRVSNLDLLPSLAALAGQGAPPGLDGRSWLSSAPSEDRLAFVVESAIYFRGAALRKGDHKLIASCLTGAKELFDLRADPAERANLLRSQRALALALDRELWTLLGVSGCAGLKPLAAPAAPAKAAPLSDEERERLEALGYLPGAEEPQAP
jgi:arylsulfatase